MVSSFAVCMSFVPFSCLIALVKISSITLDSVVNTDMLVSSMILQKMISVVLIQCDVGCEFIICALYGSEGYSFCL